MSNPKRYTGKTDDQILGSPHWEHPDGEWVKWDDYARLKAEVDELTKDADESDREYEKLKAEVEAFKLGSLLTAVDVMAFIRLKSEVERLKKFNDEALAHIAKEERKSRERLEMAEAENERLRKAGDALALSVGADWAINGPDDGTEAESVKAWRAAKDGKPTDGV